jgi:hypothetical protein
LEFFRRLEIAEVSKIKSILVKEFLDEDLEESIKIKLGLLTIAI